MIFSPKAEGEAIAKAREAKKAEEKASKLAEREAKKAADEAAIGE
jgi:hypothetical protein